MRLYLALSLICLIIVFIGVWINSILKVGQWQIKNNKPVVKCATEDQILSDLEKFNRNIFLVDKDALKTFLRQKYACIKDVSLKYKPLTSEEVMLSQRQGLVRVASFSASPEATPSSSSAMLDWNFPNSSDSSWPVADFEGVVFDTTSDIYLPFLYLLDADIKIGTRFDIKTFSNLAKIIQKINDLNLSFTQIKNSQGFLMVNSSPKLIFSTTNDLKVALISLQLILNKSKIEDREVEIIDLRFDKPIVIYKEKKKQNL